MKKIIILLIFSLGLSCCGPTDDEIQSQIDDAVNQALDTTTTEPTTTTTSVDPVYEDCLKNREITNEMYKLTRRALINMVESVTAYANKETFEFEKYANDAFIEIEEVLRLQATLPTPENNTQYQKYYIAINNAVENATNVARDIVMLQSGYTAADIIDSYEENVPTGTKWLKEYSELPSCTK
jgi:hypothetical protein